MRRSRRHVGRERTRRENNVSTAVLSPVLPLPQYKPPRETLNAHVERIAPPRADAWLNGQALQLADRSAAPNSHTAVVR